MKRIFLSAYILFFIPIFIPGIVGAHHFNRSLFRKTVDQIGQDSIPDYYPASFFDKICGDDTLIIPGKSIGIFKVDIKSKSFLKDLKLPLPQGRGVIQRGIYSSIWHYEKSSAKKYEIAEGARSSSQGDHKSYIRMLRTTDSRFKTKQGIGVGSSFAEISKTYDKLKASYTYQTYPNQKSLQLYLAPRKGIIFEMTTHHGQVRKKSICHAVMVTSLQTNNPIPIPLAGMMSNFEKYVTTTKN